MKCSECAEYKACSRKYDLRIRRRRCGKADPTKYVAMKGDSMTKIAELEEKRFSEYSAQTRMEDL